MNKTANDVELRQVFEVLARWWWIVVLAGVLAGAAGYALSASQQPVYEATASVIVGQAIRASNLDKGNIETSNQLALTYADFARRQPILEAVVETLRLSESWRNLRRRVSVKQVKDTQLLEIVVEADSRREAESIADEISRQLILISPTSLQNQADEERLEFVQRRLLDLKVKMEIGQSQLNERLFALGETSSPEQKAVIQADIDKLEDRLIDWEAAYVRFLSFAEDEQPDNFIAVVDKGYAKPTRIKPNVRLTTIITAIAGLVLASGIVFVMDLLDDRLMTVEDIRQAVGFPVLTSLEKGRSYDSYPPLTMKLPRSPIAEAFRDLRTRVSFLSLGKPIGAVLITSPNPSDGKSFTAANLAIVMAQAGFRTVLVDADLRRPAQHKNFDLHNDRGLSNLIMEANALFENKEGTAGRSFGDQIDKVTYETQQDRLEVLTAGTIPPNPSELIASNGLFVVAEALREKFDYIIVDSSPTLAVTDALLLVPIVDFVILVSSAKQTSGKNLKKALARFASVDANVAGVVLNRAPKSLTGKYPYYELDEEVIDGGDRSSGGLRKRIAGYRQALERAIGKWNPKNRKHIADSTNEF